MPAPEVEFHLHDGYVEARYLGSYSIARYKEQMRLSVEGCLKRKGKRLLVNITGLEKFKPTTAERHKMGVYGAEVSRGLERVAAFGTAEQIEPGALATTVARNRGLKVQAFTDREQAVAWLSEP